MPLFFPFPFGLAARGGCANYAQVKSMVQFVSQVRPPSRDMACSHRGVSVSVCSHRNRTDTGSPRSVSSAKKDPVPSSNLPTTGTSNWCGAFADSHQIAQVPLAGSKDRKAMARYAPPGKLRKLSSTLPLPPRTVRLRCFCWMLPLLRVSLFLPRSRAPLRRQVGTALWFQPMCESQLPD